jgi:hypothetical protein
MSKNRRLTEVSPGPSSTAYAINRQSTPQREANRSMQSMMCLATALCSQSSVTEGARFVGRSETISADEIDAVEAEEQAQTEAAGAA